MISEFAVTSIPSIAQINVWPMLNERQDAFVERADRVLKRSIPDRNSRMSAIAQAWSMSPSEQQLQQRAREALASAVDSTADKLDQFYVTRTNRPIFPEHETRGPDGSVQRYDRAALAAIVDRCNRRIIDTGDLAAMSAGHTPTPSQQATGMQMPDMVGFTGPFRLGLIGQDAPRWCIFADEHIFKDDYSRVLKMPRRSPEVWLEPKMADRVLDPIAVLGSETPRLDTGIGRFSRRLDPARYTNVARYSMAAMPSGSNTFVPTGKYSAEGENMDSQMVQSIVEAVMQGLASTAQWAWLTQQMGAEQNPVPASADTGPTPSPETIPAAGDSVSAQAPGATSASNSEAAPGTPNTTDSATPNDAAPAQPTATAPAPEASASQTDNTDSGATPDELASMNDDEKQEYSRLSPTHQYGYMKARRRHCKAGAGGAMQYSADIEKARYSKLEQALVQSQGEVAALRRERTRTERYSRLSQLAQVFDFNADEEIADCVSMNDDQFNRHCERTIAKYSRRDPMAGMPDLLLPSLEAAKADEDKKERYSRRAIEIATRANGTITADEAFAQAKAEIDKQ